MAELNHIATIMVALHDLLVEDPLKVNSPFRDRSVNAVQEAINDLKRLGENSSLINNYGAVDEFRSDFKAALFWRLIEE
jgi:hypothetical protein